MNDHMYHANLRLNTNREQDKKAWETIQQNRGKYRSVNDFLIAAICSYADVISGQAAATTLPDQEERQEELSEKIADKIIKKLRKSQLLLPAESEKPAEILGDTMDLEALPDDFWNTL